MKWQWLSVLSKEYGVEESLHPLRKRVLKVDNIEGGYKRKKNNFQNFNIQTPFSQITDINLNHIFLLKNLKCKIT
jgi:hypothetical protein